MELSALLNQLLLGFLAFFFGLGYNWFVAYLEKRGAGEPYTAFLVAAGVLITLALAMPLVGLNDVLIMTIFFALTGGPMMVGSAARYLKKKEQGRRMFDEK